MVKRKKSINGCKRFVYYFLKKRMGAEMVRLSPYESPTPAGSLATNRCPAPQNKEGPSRVGSSSPGGSIALAVGPHAASVHGGLGVQGSTLTPPTSRPCRSVGGQHFGGERPTVDKGAEIPCSPPLPSPTPPRSRHRLGADPSNLG